MSGHGSNRRTLATPKTHFCLELVGIGLLALLTGCGSTAPQGETVWPPQDFVLEVEWSSGGPPAQAQTKRFTVDASGVCVYSKSASPVIDPVSRAALPVFETMCAYRMRLECTRLLARKLHLRGIATLEPQQGAVDDVDAPAIRLRHGAFGPPRIYTAVGQAHGTFVRVLHVVNSFLPSSESFWLPGMAGDSEPEHLADVPAPLAGAGAALAWHEERLALVGDRTGPLLEAFALACRVGDRARSEQLLSRWEASVYVAASQTAPFGDGPRLQPEMLRRMLP